MTRGFLPLDHTADKAIEAWGADLPQLFAAAAEGMFSESVACEGIAAAHEWSIEVDGDSIEELLRAWLSELLWVSEREDEAICRVEIEELQTEPLRLRGRAWGGSPPADSPHTGAPVKAVTYHDLRVWQEQAPSAEATGPEAPAQQGVWRAHIVFDV
ncbi:MAG: archease [Armatimonadota bacterium]